MGGLLRRAACLWQRVDLLAGPDTPASCMLGLTEGLACGRTFSLLGADLPGPVIPK